MDMSNISADKAKAFVLKDVKSFQGGTKNARPKGRTLKFTI